MKFEEIQSAGDIKNIVRQAHKNGSDDGGSISFELKGTACREDLGMQKRLCSDDKKNLAKEICAFANTYGGMLCYHHGEYKRDITPFPSSVKRQLYKSLETWLNDCLEPRLLGINMKDVEGYFLISIPESFTKPHRSAPERQYYFRNNTSSVLMPEIMISAMYRSNDHLSFDASVEVRRHYSKLRFDISISNYSNVSGEKPKVYFQLHTHPLIKIEIGFPDKFSNSSHSKHTELLERYGIMGCNNFVSLPTFARTVLYPKDVITEHTDSTAIRDLHDLKYGLLTVDCMFINSEVQTKFYILDFSSEGRSHVIASTGDSKKESILSQYRELIE